MGCRGTFLISDTRFFSVWGGQKNATRRWLGGRCEVAPAGVAVGLALSSGVALVGIAIAEHRQCMGDAPGHEHDNAETVVAQDEGQDNPVFVHLQRIPGGREVGVIVRQSIPAVMKDGEAQLLLQGLWGVFRVHHHDMQQRCPVVYFGEGFFCQPFRHQGMKAQGILGTCSFTF
jgi:hypothetical protein